MTDLLASEAGEWATIARLNRTEMLLGMTRTLAGYDTLDGVLAALVELMSRELHAERSTIFLSDMESGELYSRVAQGRLQREIRMARDLGVAGHVFTAGEGVVVNDAYSDPRFNASIDELTGFTTRNILCAPIRTVRGDVIGVAQVLNRSDGDFDDADLVVLESMTTQAASALQTSVLVERMRESRAQEIEFLDIVSDVTSELDLAALLNRVMREAARMLNADRSTLFLNDEKTAELYTVVGEGLGATEIRLPNSSGIAGAVFTTGEAINIPHAYADLRFNPAFDRQTGYFTLSILCVPIVNKVGKKIGVTQMLNKHGGPFSKEDESRLRAFTAQVSMALENAKLFNDVQYMKNYNESILESMSSGVITLDEDGRIVTCNAGARRLMRRTEAEVIGRPAEECFGGPNAWVLERVKRVQETWAPDMTMDGELIFAGDTLSVNLSVLPLKSVDNTELGSMIMIEDISTEKRVKSTMSRYMDPKIADQLLQQGAEVLGGSAKLATILFADIRGFTSLTEELGPSATVTFLNEYFTIMVDCIQDQAGMLDKFVGDAIMAIFGLPMAHDDDEDRAVRAAIAMLTALAAWNRDRVAEGKKAVDIGVGLNSDVIVSGNIGSPKRMDYTVIGDGVNLASRLESACKQYGTKILVSEYTFQRLRGTYRTREIDRVIVKGKSEPVGVYEILDYHTEGTFPNLVDALAHFRDGLARYRAQNWEGARREFEAVLAINPSDRVSSLYLERCDWFTANPPDEEWDGVWVMESK